jgi:hypothetical protein
MAMLIAVSGGVATELVKNPGDAYLWLCLTVLLGTVVTLGVLFSRSMLKLIATGRGHIQLNIERRVSRAKALIAFVSLGPGRSSALEAASYHAEGGVLRDLWLITSTAASADAGYVRAEVEKLFPHVTVHPTVFLTDVYSIPEAKAEVENLRKKCLLKHKSERDVICDFTGLTKSPSAGMMLACAPRNARLQYMHPKGYLANGYADTALGSNPVEVEIAYDIEEADAD